MATTLSHSFTHSLVMSLSLPTTLSSVSFSPSSATLLHPHSLPVIKWKPTNKNRFLPTFCSQKQTSIDQQVDNHHESNKTTNSRRNILLGLGALTSTLAATFTTHVPIAIGSSTPIHEFGSQPQLLNSTIRVLVPKPKSSEKGRETAVLVVEGIDIKTDGPVRFDVYVAKPNGGYQRVGSSDFGVFAGSLVDLARIRVGRNSPNGALELGISELLNEIQAADDSTEKLVVTLQPRIGIGEVMIGGVHVEYRGSS